MIDFRIWQIAGWTMLHYLWVGAVLAVVAAAVRLLLRSLGANLRYLAALGCFAVLGIAPLPIAVVVTSRLPQPPQIEPLAAAEHAPDWTPMPPPLPVIEESPQRVATAPPVLSSPPPAPAPRASELLQSALDRAAMGLPWLWLIGAPLTFLLTTIGLLGAERLRRQSRLVEDLPIAETCRRLAAALGISRRAGVAICDRIAAPILLGVFRPLILLPAVALTGWDPQQLEMVLLHELAHVRRWDNLVNLMQRVVESLLFFHPLVWIVSAWVRWEREHCCDEIVVARTRQPRAYAEMLVSLSERVSQAALRNPPLPHGQVVSSMAQHSLVARIRRILKKEEQSMQVSRKTVGLMFAGVIGLVIVIGSYYARAGRAEDGPKAGQPSGKIPAANTASILKPEMKVSEEDRKALLQIIDRQLGPEAVKLLLAHRITGTVRSKLNVILAAPKAEVSTVRAFSGLANRDVDDCVLPVTIENRSSQPIRTSLAHEWFGGMWPPTDLYAAVLVPARPGRNKNRPSEFKPVFLAGDSSELTKPTIIEPGKSTSLSPRIDWPGTGSVYGGDIVYPNLPGVYTVMFLLVFQTNGVRQYVVSEPIAFRYQKPDKDVQLKPAEPKKSDPSGKTSAAEPVEETPPASDPSVTKAGAKTESTSPPARGSAAELNTDQPWAKAVAKALKDFEVQRCDSAASLAVGPHRAYRIVLRHAEKEYVGPRPQFASIQDDGPFVIRYRRVELAAFTGAALTPEESGRIAWQTWNDEQPYFKKVVHLGRGMGLDWYARATLYDQELLREPLALEGGDDRLGLLTDAIFVQDKGSFTHNLCAYLLSRAGDRAIPYVKAAVEKRPDGDKAIYALGYIRTPAATEFLQSLYAAEATRDMAADALLHRPLRSSAKDQYLDMLKRRVSVSQPMRACVQFRWKDALPLISEIYLRPKSLPEFEEAFEAKRDLEGRPVSKEFQQARQKFYQSATPGEYDRFRNFLLKSPDTESAIVFAIPVFVPGGKMNDKDRARERQLGRDVLRKLPRKQVEEILSRLIRSFDALPSMQPTAKELSEVLSPE